MLRNWARSLINLFYPDNCVACGGELSQGESKICTFCRWDMPMTEYVYVPDNYVVQIFSGRFPFVRACSYLYFRGGANPSRRMVHSMKYYSRADVAYALGEMFGVELAESGLYADIDLLVPIPLHWTRRIKRGYNQSEELCRGMSASMGVKCDFRSTRRSRITTQQAKLSRRKRWENVSGAFKVIDTRALQGKHILLVDDVLTTGSTIESCATEIINRVEGVRISIATLAVVHRESKSRK